MTATLRSTAQALLLRLAAHGVDRVFGIPGTHNLPFYRHLEASGLSHTTPRHEQGAGFAADGYARATGRPALCLTTTGPGLTNALTAVAQAYSDSVPMLVLSPSLPREVDGADTGFLHEMKDQHAAANAIAARSQRLCSAHDAIAAVDRVMIEYAVGRRRPVHWDVPLDALEQELPVPQETPLAPQSVAPGFEEIERAVALLRDAESCAFVFGGGAVDAGQEATELAHRLGVPVITTINGKGTVSERDPISLGSSIRLATAQDFLSRCDVVLAVGTELAESDLWRRPPLPLRGRMIRVDIDPGQLHKNQAAEVAIVGDARLVLRALLDALPARPRRLPTGLLDDLRRRLATDIDRDGAPYRRIIAGIEQGLGDDAILVNDSAMACYYGAAHYLPVTHSRRFLYPTGYATLGYALPAAIGAKLARPDLPVAVLIGDGGLLFTVGELSTAAAERLPLPVIVHANGGYGEIRREMLARHITPIGVDIPAYDVQGLADAFRLAAEKVTDVHELPALLRAALARDRPTLLQVS